MQGYRFDETGMRRAIASIRKSENEPRGGRPRSTPYVSSGTPELWLDGYNAAGETIPAMSCAIITTGSVLSGVYHASLAKPSTTFSRNICITVDAAISAANLLGYHVEAGLVKYDTGTPAVGETWGPKPGHWTISKNYPGFRILGVVDSTNKIALVVPEPITSLTCKLTSTMSPGGSATAKIWIGDNPSSAIASAFDDITVYSWIFTSGEDLESGTRVDVEWNDSGGYWKVIGAECPPA